MFRLIFLLLLAPLSVTLFSADPYIVYRGHHGGMFTSFMMVVGLLDGYDRGDFAGVDVSLEKTELYFDGAYGSNWWEYYFAPIHMKKPHHSVRMPLSNELLQRIALRGHQTLSRQRCHELIRKYITIKPEIVREVDRFFKNNFHGEKLIGVHYRGTDKFSAEAGYVSPQTVCSKIETYIQKLQTTRLKIFVATDSEAFLQMARQIFGEKVVFFEMKRSWGSLPIHMDPAVRGYIRGKTAILDCLALSRCDLLIRTSSNLSNVSMLLNSRLPVIRLNNSNWGFDR